MDQVRSHISAKDGSQSGAVDVSSIQPTTQDDGEPEHRILSFAELKTLIEQGKTDGIPHNRVIPDELNVRSPRVIYIRFLLTLTIEGEAQRVQSSYQEKALGNGQPRYAHK